MLLLVLVAARVFAGGSAKVNAGYSDFVNDLQSGVVTSVVVNPDRQKLTYHTAADKKEHTTGFLDQQGDDLVKMIQDAKVQSVEIKPRAGSTWWSVLIGLAPFVLIILIWVFLMNQMQGGGSKVMSFGKARAKRMTADSPKISFRDVAGAEEAVEVQADDPEAPQEQESGDEADQAQGGGVGRGEHVPVDLRSTRLLDPAAAGHRDQGDEPDEQHEGRLSGAGGAAGRGGAGHAAEATTLLT